MKFARMIAIPALDLVLHMAPLKPFVAQYPRHIAVCEPLCPRGVVIMDIFQGNGVLAFENHSRPRSIEPGAN